MEKYFVAINPRFIGKIPQEAKHSWIVYNNTFVNRQVTAQELLEEIRRGHSYTTIHKHVKHELGRTSSGHVRYSCHRRGENFECGQHLALDFDAGNETSDYRKVAEDEFIKRYAAFVHTTASHTEEAPRCRAVFLLDRPVRDPEEYGHMAAGLIWRYQMTADRKCSDPVRVFFGAENCEYVWLGNVLPQRVARATMAQMQGEMKEQRRQRPTPPPMVATDPLAEKMVADALRHLPTWGEYEWWLSILMAVHHIFPDYTGIRLIENWSPGYPGEVERKFSSFKRTGNQNGAITGATLFAQARQYGWDRRDAISRLGANIVGNQHAIY